MRIAILFGVAVTPSLAAAAPVSVPWQARLLGLDGQPVDGTHDLTLRVYDAGGVIVWQRVYDDVPVENGFVAVTLTGTGTGTPGGTLDHSHFTGSPTVGVVVDAQPELSPRSPIGDHPRAAATSSVGTASTPARSCLHVLESGGSTGDGVYTLVGVAGSGTRQAFCDMTIDGGGWTLILNKGMNFSQAGWSRVSDAAGRPHLLADTRPSTDNKDVLVRVPSTQVMVRKVGVVGSPEVAFRTPELGYGWSGFYDGYFGRDGQMCASGELSTNWVQKFSAPGFYCECKGGGEGCYLNLLNIVGTAADVRSDVCGEGTFQNGIGDSSTNSNALATHFPPGCTVNPADSWTRVYVR
jgi:hypothetical protein